MSKIDELTAFESSLAERTAGMSIASLDDPNVPKMGLLGALAWVHVKRSEPTLTFDAYMKRVTTREVTNYLFPDEPAEDPDAGFLDGPGGGAGEGASGVEGGVLSGDGGPAV